MPEGQTQVSEQITKWIVILTGLAYVLGFIVENSWLSKFGIYDYRLANSRYLSAGLLYAILSLIIAGLIPLAVVAVASKQSSANVWTKGDFTIILVIGLLLGNFLAVILSILIWCAVLNKPLDEFSWVWVLSTASAVVFVVIGFLRLLQGKGLAAVFAGIVLLGMSASLFGRDIYDNVPSEFGGRSAQEVDLVATAQLAHLLGDSCRGDLTTDNDPPDADTLAVLRSMRLLVSASNEYVLAAMCNGEWRAVTIERSSVRAVIEGVD